jgi:pyrroline-5-carboxylate reductase
MKDTLVPLREIFSKEKPLLISIAAGIRLNDLARWAGDSLPIVRAMPNTPALVGTGASALCANSNVNDTQHDIAESIMRSTGIVTWVEDESLIDVVTALSGSGPAYYFYIMEIMEKAGIELGLTKEQARLLTLQTALGAAKMAMESEDDPEVLRKQVTSPGGTTEQAIKVMQEGKLNELFSKAIRAAFERSQELAKILGGDKQA